MKNSTLCYIEQDNAYLMLHRVKKKNDANHDKWIGIGGGLEEGESPLDCILRETFEETGLTLVSPSYRGLVTFVSDIYETEQMHVFTCTDFCGELTDCDEGTLEWVPKSEVINLPIWEGDKIFLDLISKPCDFFALKLVYKGDELVSAVLNGNKIR
ncbi:MAG: NUDIX domain-containing protein [Oscillospiraceae bacterium]|nr:NUDIX domain-containing protein [Oscillospiraceae bacterium]